MQRSVAKDWSKGNNQQTTTKKGQTCFPKTGPREVTCANAVNLLPVERKTVNKTVHNHSQLPACEYLYLSNRLSQKQHGSYYNYVFSSDFLVLPLCSLK